MIEPTDSPKTSRPNLRGSTRRRHHRRFYGLSDEEQSEVFREQLEAIIRMFDAMEDYFTAELDAKHLAIQHRMQEAEPEDIDAEFSEGAPDASIA